MAVKFAQSGRSHTESSEREGHHRSDAREDEASEAPADSDQKGLVAAAARDGDLEKECQEREEEIKLLEEKDQVLK